MRNRQLNGQKALACSIYEIILADAINTFKKLQRELSHYLSGSGISSFDFICNILITLHFLKELDLLNFDESFMVLNCSEGQSHKTTRMGFIMYENRNFAGYENVCTKSRCQGQGQVITPPSIYGM